jgi:hypothetical protein
VDGLAAQPGQGFSPWKQRGSYFNGEKNATQVTGLVVVCRGSLNCLLCPFSAGAAEHQAAGVLAAEGLAVGANAVLVRDRLELGAVYSTPLATQRSFDFGGLLVKMVIRY